MTSLAEMNPHRILGNHSEIGHLKHYHIYCLVNILFRSNKIKFASSESEDF